MQTRSLVHSRPQRNLLLLIDGKKPEDQLLASVTGIGRSDLATLRDLGLIASSDAGGSLGESSVHRPNGQSSPVVVDMAATVAPAMAPSASRPELADHASEAALAQPSFDHVSRTLTALISSELGLRGFTLTLAVERASGIDALLDVADRVLAQVESRKGMAAADKARRSLFGR